MTWLSNRFNKELRRKETCMLSFGRLVHDRHGCRHWAVLFDHLLGFTMPDRSWSVLPWLIGPARFCRGRGCIIFKIAPKAELFHEIV